MFLTFCSDRFFLILISHAAFCASEKPSVLLDLFPNSHFKFSIIQEANPKFHNATDWKQISNFEDINSQILQHAVHSLESLGTHYGSFPDANKLKTLHQVTKHSSYFVGCYVVPVRIFGALSNVMKVQRISRDWPHHTFIFSDVNDVNFRIFFNYESQYTLLRGVILFVDMKLSLYKMFSKISPPILSSTAQSVFEKPWSTETVMEPVMNAKASRVWWNSQESCISPSVYALPDASYNTCEFFATRKPVILPFHLTCVYHILKGPFNLTDNCFSLLSDELNPGINFILALKPNVLVDGSTIKDSQIKREYDWPPYAVSIERFKFISVRRQVYFPVGSLTEPFDWKSWASIFVAGLLLILQLWVCRHFQTNSGNLADFVISVVSSFLDQPAINSLSSASRFKGKICVVPWLLWILAMVVIVNGYKGLLYSFLASGIKMWLPGSLAELVNDKSFCIFSTDEASYFEESLLRNVLLDPIMKGTPGVDYRMEYFILNQNLKFTGANSKDALRFAAISDTQNVESKKGYVIRDEYCPQFAIIDKDPLQAALLFGYFTDDTVISAPVEVTGNLVIHHVLIGKNFFHEQFMHILGLLDSSGYTMAIFDYLNRWRRCIQVQIISEKISHSQGNSLSRCLKQTSGSIYSVEPATPKPSPVSIIQLNTTLIICTICLLASILLLFLEMLGNPCFSTIIYITSYLTLRKSVIGELNAINKE